MSLQTLEENVNSNINEKIKQNNARAITGIILNGVLRNIISFVIAALGLFYTKEEINDKLEKIEHTPGPDGKSAYQIWLAAGNTGTEAEFIASLKGAEGKSAYQIWLAAGNTGTEVEYLTALKGNPGVNAPLVKFKYSVDGITNWHEAATSNDFYLSVSVDNGSTWNNALKFKGSEGVNGKSAFEVWRTIAGNETKTLTDYWSYLATLGGFAYNLIFDNTASIELSQPRAWIITTLTWVAASISKVSYSTDGIIFTTATNGVNNIQVAANTILYLQITFASGTQAVVYVAGTY